jgi:hypothetical protein
MTRSARPIIGMILLLLTSSVGHASGVITVAGKLISITRTDYVIETPAQIFRIKRSAVTPAQAAQLEHTETQVALKVPFKAIESVSARQK